MPLPPPTATSADRPAAINPPRAAVAALPQTGYISFEGADAASFLQGQLSNDVAAIGVGAAQWTSYNSPKGRMLATMLLWRASETSFHAFVAADLAATLRKRLAMFVMRAKVVVTDHTAEGVCFGVSGTAAHHAVCSALGAAPETGHGVTHEGAAIVTTPDGRVLIHVPIAIADDTGRRLATQANLVAATHWDWHAIAAGIATVVAATQDLFIPQAANWDLVDGVNFKKGCYPGQEIVARMQYLGKLKERLFRLHHDGDAPSPGAPLYSTVFGDQACGTVVNAAPAPEGGSDMLAVVQMQAAAESTLHLAAPDGPSLTLLDLPYAIPAQVAPNRPKLA